MAPDKNRGCCRCKELITVIFWRDVLCEFLCTFLLTFGFSAIGVNLSDDAGSPNWLLIGTTMGFLVFVIVESFAHISGAHMNPIVSFVFLCLRQVSIPKAILYIISQCLGSIAGAYLVYIATPEKYRTSLPYFKLHPDLEGAFVGVCVEAVLSAILIFAILGGGDEKHRKIDVPPLVPGLAVAMDIMCGGKYTGASMNPALALGPAMVAKDWTNYWVFWAGPFMGAILALLAYKGFTYMGDKSWSGSGSEFAEEEMDLNSNSKGAYKRSRGKDDDMEEDPWTDSRVSSI